MELTKSEFKVESSWYISRGDDWVWRFKNDEEISFYKTILKLVYEWYN